MTQVGDRVTYRGRTAIVACVHSNGSANLVYGETYSEDSAGIWPVAHAANVPATRFEPADDESGTHVDETAVPDDTGDDVGTQGDVVIKDYDSVDDFVDRTPVSDVASDIRSGDYDDVLDAIEAAEEDGRDRDTVYDAIESRR